MIKREAVPKPPDPRLSEAQLLEARETIMTLRQTANREGATREVDCRLQGVIAGLDLALGTLTVAYFT